MKQNLRSYLLVLRGMSWQMLAVMALLAIFIFSLLLSTSGKIGYLGWTTADPSAATASSLRFGGHGSDQPHPSSAGDAMFLSKVDNGRIERLVQLAVQRGEDRQTFLNRLSSPDIAGLEPELRFAWRREWPEMADHTDLLLAAHVQYVELAKSLLTAGADPNSKTSNGTTALIYASDQGNTELVRALLAAAADVNAPRDGGETALLLAAHRGYFEIVRLLTAAGADIRARAHNGFTVLMAGANSGSARIVRLFLQQGADARAVNRSGWSALMFAAGGDAAEIGRLLIEKGADVNARSWDDGWTPLLMATSRRSPSLLRLLLQHAAEVNARKADGTTALILAATDKVDFLPADLECVQILLDSGADPNLADNSGWTPLMSVAKYGGDDVAEALLNHGADVGAKNSNGQTALAVATQAGQRDVAEVLRRAGAKE
jgi:ankyrin repeat protein